MHISCGYLHQIFFFSQGLDLLRLALLNDSGSNYFISDVDSGKAFLGELLAFAL